MCLEIIIAVILCCWSTHYQSMFGVSTTDEIPAPNFAPGITVSTSGDVLLE